MATSHQTIQNYRQVGALFDNTDDANRAVKELKDQGFSSRNIRTTILDDRQKPSVVPEDIFHRSGYSDRRIRFFKDGLLGGKVMVTVFNVPEELSGVVIHICNENGSQYDPDGSRNVRDDVVGMTTGALAGAALGALVAGPLGAAAGEVGGGLIGSALGTMKEESE